jgi:CubicO group peptidase (beta-lactamase class C family)
MLCVAFDAFADDFPYAWSISSGFRGSAHIAYISPPKEQQRIALKSTSTSESAKYILDNLFTTNKTKALLAAKGSDIFYERFSFGVSRRSTPLGYSISKSLVALAVGRAVCDGHIASIKEPIRMYVPALAGTSWGESSIRDVLRMSSGAYTTEMYLNGWKDLPMADEIDTVYGGRMTGDFIEIMRRADNHRYPAGEVFNYSNLDTVALSLVVEGATRRSFPEFFEQTVWVDAGATSRGGWIINGLKQTSAFQGFSATPHDWIRLGVMVLRELKRKDTCYGQFLKEATSKQIPASTHAAGYGYQIWHNCALDVDFCFIGYGGQFLLFNVEEEIVVYHHGATSSLNVWNTPYMMSGLVDAVKAASIKTN